MKKLTCNDFSNGFPTDHRIRFMSKRTLVEGGYRLGADESVREYEGVLFESNHSETHLCVRVTHDKHWGRSRDWHGYVYRGNVTDVTLVDEHSNPIANAAIEQVADQAFLFAWGSLCNKGGPSSTDLPA